MALIPVYCSFLDLKTICLMDTIFRLYFLVRPLCPLYLQSCANTVKYSTILKHPLDVCMVYHKFVAQFSNDVKVVIRKSLKIKIKFC